MEIRTVFWCGFVLSQISAIVTSATGDRTIGKRLIDSLINTNAYDRRVIPVNPETGKVKVELSVTVERINEVDDRRQELFWVGYVTVKWNNPFLAWDKDKWNGTKLLFLKEQEMWVPDICIIERLNDDIGFKDQKRRLIQVSYKGNIRWLLGGDVISTRCPLNVGRFPFDDQSCSFHIGSYIIPTEIVEIVDTRQSRYDGIGGPNALWTVTGWSSTILNYTYDTDLGPMRYDFLHFTLNLKRKSTYFVIHIIAPLLLMSILLAVVFRLPADGGEKISFGITLLLAFNVIQLVITENMPQTSDSMPIIAGYVAILMAFSAFSIPVSVFVIYIHNHGCDFCPSYLRHLLCGSSTKRCDDLNENYGSTNGSTNGDLSFVNENCKTDEDKMEETILSNRKPETSAEVDKNIQNMMRILVKHVQFQNKLRKTKLLEMDEGEKRKKAAERLDRFFFHTCVVLLIILTIICTVLLAVN